MALRYNPFTSNFDFIAEAPGGSSDVFHTDPLTADKVVLGAGTDFVKVSDIDVDAMDNMSNLNTISVNDIATTQQNLDLEPGVDIQEYSSVLDQFALLSPTLGDVIFADTGPAWNVLPLGGEGEVLKINSGLPSWQTDASGGDVSGPGSATDDNFASFDGTTGKLIQDSGFSAASFLQVANDLSDLNDAAQARSNLGVEIGVDVQAWDAQLDQIAALTPVAGDLIVANATPEWSRLATGYGLLGATGGQPAYLQQINTNFSFLGNVGSAARFIQAYNTLNSAGSGAAVVSRVAGATASDAVFQAVIDSVQTWTWGVDNSDSDSWILSASDTLGTSNVLEVTVGGVVNIPGSLTIGTPLAETSGGTGLATYTAGDLLYSDSSDSLAALGVGGEGQVLKVDSGLPSWQDDDAGGDVFGPASATDGNLASFDSTTGKLIQDSGIPSANVLVDGDIGTEIQAFDADLEAISSLAGTGYIVRTSTTPTYETRTIEGTSGKVEVSDGDGVSGNSIISIPDSLINSTSNTYNLGISISGTVITLHAIDGSALSSNNPAFLVMASKTNPLSKVYTLTSNYTVDSTEMDGNLLGTTTLRAWASNMPLFIYFVINDADDTPVPMFSRVPGIGGSPSAANIGDPSAANANVQYSFYSWDDITEADYEGNQCVMVGSIQATKNASDEWTFGTVLPLGNFQFNIPFAYPRGHNGNDADSFFVSGGATVPSFSLISWVYFLKPEGRCVLQVLFYADGGTDGSGAVAVQMGIPFTSYQNTAGATHVTISPVQLLAASGPSSGSTIRGVVMVYHAAPANIFLYTVNDFMEYQDFTNGNRQIGFQGEYTVQGF